MTTDPQTAAKETVGAGAARAEAPPSHATTYVSCAQAWRSLVTRARTEGAAYTDQDGRACNELRNELVTIMDASDAATLVKHAQRTAPWLYPSLEELRSVIFNTGPVINDYSYAPRLLGNPNYVETLVIPLLRKHALTRRAVLVPYDPTSDSSPDAENVPVHLAFQFRIADGLEVTCMQRSCDALLGLPADFYQLRALQEYIAERLNVKAGPITILFSSLHWFATYTDASGKMLGNRA